MYLLGHVAAGHVACPMQGLPAVNVPITHRPAQCLHQATAPLPKRQVKSHNTHSAFCQVDDLRYQCQSRAPSHRLVTIHKPTYLFATYMLPYLKPTVATDTMAACKCTPVPAQASNSAAQDSYPNHIRIICLTLGK